MKLYVTTQETDFGGGHVLGIRTLVTSEDDADFAEVEGTVMVRPLVGIDLVPDKTFPVPIAHLAEFIDPEEDAGAERNKLRIENAKLERTANDLMNECLSAANHIEVALAALHLLIHDPLMLGPDATKRIVRDLRNTHEDLRKAVSKTDLIPF